jgi:cytochrome c biogenesis protein CcmG/thiol:disulfide interchange protein DsbE
MVMRRSAVPVMLGILAIALVGMLAYALTRTGDKTATTIDAKVEAGQAIPAPGATKVLPWLTKSSTKSATLADFRGKVVVLNFWASWCIGCKDEAALLENTQHQIAKKDGVVLGMARIDDPVDSLGFIRKYGLTYPSLRDADQKLGQDYGVSAMPETFVLDRQGRIRGISRGEVTKTFLDTALKRAGIDTPAAAR